MKRLRHILFCLTAVIACLFFFRAPPEPLTAIDHQPAHSCADCSHHHPPRISPRALYEPSPDKIRDASTPARFIPITDDDHVSIATAIEQDYAPWMGLDDFAFRSKAIQLDPLLTSGEPLPLHTQLRIPLFDDIEFAAEVTNSFINVNRTVSTRTRIHESDWGRAVFAYTAGELHARILHPESGRTFGIEYNRKDGQHYLLEFDPAKLHVTQSCGVGNPAATPPVAAPALGDQADPEEIHYLDESALADESVAAAVIDVLVVYSENALTEAGSVASMDNTIAVGIALANDAHSNTDTGIYIQLIHSELLAGYNSSGDNGTELSALSGGTGGYANTHALRDTVGADFVAAISTVGGGIANLLNNGSGNSNVAFSSTGRNSFASYTVAHEIGHNMGLSHAKDQNFQAGPTGGSIGNDAAGWHWHPNPGQNGYCSVLTYTGSSFFADNLGHSRVGLFSDPNLTHMGEAAGHVNDGNNARVLRALASTYAAYRTRSITPNPGIEIDVPANNEIFARGTTETITWESNGVSGNVRLDLYKAGNFLSTIDASTHNDRIYYWDIPANLVSGNNYSIRISSVSAPAVVGISDNFVITEVIYESNLDTDPGFTTTGDWEFGAPTNGNSNGGPTSAYTGTNIYDTNLGGASFSNSDLTAGPFDCGDFADITLQFASQFSVAGGWTASVEVSTDGTNFTTVESQSGEFEGSWTIRSIDLSAHADSQDSVYIRWGHTGSGGNFAGMAIDDVTLSGRLTRALEYSDTEFDESLANDGTIGNSLTITLIGDTFTGSNGEDFAGSKATISNLPNNLDADLIRSSPTEITFSLSGTALAHENINDVPNLSVEFLSSAFTDGNAATVPGAVQTALVIDFEDARSFTLSITPTSISEAGGVAIATVTRNDTGGELTANLLSNDTTEATVPPTLFFADGVATANFTITAVDDALLDGTQSVLITVSAPLFATQGDTIDVTDSEQLTLSLADSAISEFGGTTTATVTRPGIVNGITILLSSDDTTEATVPSAVVIPNGSASATFPINAVDDTFLDGDQTVNITISSTGFFGDSSPLTVTDYEPLGLSAPAPISENGGTAMITLSRSNSAGDLTVFLASSDTSEATVPASVVIPNGLSAVPVTITAVDDTLLDGDQAVIISANAAGWINASTTLTVTDHEELSAVIADSAISESGGSSIITVTRTDPSGSLIVSLSSDDGSEAIVPAIFTILNGQASGTAVISAVDDNIVDGTQTVTITATASGYQDAADSIDIEDHETLAISLADSAIPENGGSTIATLTRVDTDGELVVGLFSNDTTEATVPVSITIPDAVGSVTFAISAVDDAIVDGTQTVTITASASDYIDSAEQLDVTDHEPLTITISQGQIPENGGTSPGLITRTDTDGDLSVFIASSDTGEAGNISLTILDGDASASFTVTAVDDDVIDGTQTVTLTASAIGYEPDTASIDITDHETLTLAFSPLIINENSGPAAATATLTRSATNGAITVSLSSGDTSELTVPPSISLADGEDSATFPIDAIDDLLADGDQIVAITASTGGYVDGVNTITVTDDETLQLIITPESIIENAGPSAATGTVTRTSLNLSAPVTVTIASDDTSEASAIPNVTIPAGIASVSFPIDAVDDNLLDGIQTATFTASAAGFAPGIASIDVTDYEALILTIQGDLNEDGGTVNGSVTRTNFDQTAPLSVILTNGDSTEISIPVTVTIPADQSSEDFSIQAVDDDILDGTQTVTITASSAGFVDASDDIDVADDVVTIDVVATPPEGGSVTGDTTVDPDSGPFAISATPNASHVFTAWSTTHGSIANDQIDGIPANASVTVSAIFNARPVVTSVSLTTNEDTPLIAATPVTDAEGDPFEVILVASPLRGTLTLLSTGAYTYAPNLNYFGTDSFAFRANDGANSATDATISLTVAAVNDPPILTVPSFTTSEDTAITIDLSPYATDVEGSPITFDTGSPFSYTPPANANGTISFEFVAFDGTDTSRGTATVHISPVNDPPVNTTPPSISGIPRVGETLSADIGVWNDNIDIAPGNLTYTYQWRRGPAVLSTDPTYTIPPGDRGNTIVLRIIAIDDGEGIPGQASLADSAILTVENSPPVIQAFSLTVNEDDSVSFTPVASDADDDAVTFTLESQPANGSAGISGYTPNANFAGSDSFVLRANDGNGGIADFTVAVSVLPVPDVPVALDANFTTVEDTPTAIDLSPFASDADGDALIFSIGPDFTYTPVADFAGVDSFPYTVTDPSGRTATATVSITVTPVNDPPVITPFSLTVNEDSTTTLTPTLTDADDDPLTFTPSSYTPAPNYFGTDSFVLAVNDGSVTTTFTVQVTVLSVNDPPVAAGFGALTLAEDDRVDFSITIVDLDGDTVSQTQLSHPANGTGTLTSYVPNANFHGTDSYSIELDDGNGGVTIVPVNLTITPVNDLPVITPFSLTTDEDSPISFTPEVTDIDGDSLTVTPLSYTPAPNFHGTDSFLLVADDGTGTSSLTIQVTVNSVNDPPVVTPFSLTTDEDTTVSFTPTATDADGDAITFNQTSYTPPPHFHGSDSFVLIADDGTDTTTLTILVTVNSVNDLPVIAPLSLTTDEDSTVSFTPTATDADNDTVTFNRSSYTPAPNFHGTDSFELIASDSIGTSSLTVQVTVNSVNDLPVITAFSLTTDEDTPVNFSPQVSDADGDSVTVSPTSYSPPADFFGNTSLEVIADDGTGTSSLTVAITVNSVNDPPVITPFSLTTNEDTTITFSPTVTDVENDPITLSQTSYTPVAEFAGTDSFVLVASDGAATDSLTVQVTVLPVNDPPVNTALPIISGQPLVGATLSATAGAWTDVEGDTLSFSYEWSRNGAAIASGSSYTVVTADNTAALSVAVTAHDGSDGVTAESATLSIQNRAPVIPAFSLTVDEDDSVTYDHGITDPDGDTLTVEILTPADDGDASTTRYAPDANYHGPDSFTIRATDAHGLVATRIISVSVLPVNDPPIANSATFTTAEDTPLAIDLRPFASDIEGDALTFSTGATFSYEPPQDFHGTQTFDFIVSDGSATAEATVTVTITPVNDPPVIPPFTITAQEDTILTYAVPVTDVDDDTPSLFIVKAAIHGIATPTTYEPPPEFSGTDRFTLRANDGNGGIANREVHVIVEAVNDLPVAGADFANVAEEGSVLIQALQNDSDLEGDPLSILAVANPDAVIEGDAIRYSPPLNFFGSVTFTYVLSDGSDTAIGTVDINVTPVNDPPVIGSLSLTVDEDEIATFALETSDVDGDEVIVSLFRNPDHGTATATSYSPGANFHGNDSFTLRWDDQHGATGIVLVPVIVTPVNDPPVANSASLTTLEDTPLDVSLTGTDIDGDPLTFSLGPDFTYTPVANFAGSETFTFTVSDGSATDEATLTITVVEVNDPPVITPFSLTTNEDEAISFTPTATDADGDQVTISPTDYTPAPDFFGTDEFDIVADDGRGGTDRFTVVVTVQPVNDPPTITPFSLTTDEDTPIDFTVDTNDVDGDTVTVSPTRYTPAPNFFGSDSFVVVADDGTSTVTFTVEVTVNSVNDLPVNDTAPSILGTPQVGQILTIDPGSWSDLDNDPLTFTYVWLRDTLVVGSDANYPLTTADNNGSLQVVVTANDGQADSSANSALVSVQNRAPVIAALTLTVEEDGSVSYTPDISDPDGDALTITLSAGANNGTATLDSYTPNANYFGSDNFTLHALDPFGAEASLVVPITVLPVNDPPVANSASFTTDEDVPFEIDLSGLASDIDTQNLTFSIGPVFTYTPVAEFAGTDELTFVVDDGDSTASATVHITINPVDDPPLAEDDSFTGLEDETLSGNFLTNDSDPEGGFLVVLGFNQPATGSVQVSGGGDFSYQPPANWWGTDSFTYTIVDTSFAQVTATVFIEIFPVNDPPTNTELPSITGTLHVGETLVGSDGVWEDLEQDAISISHEWRRDGLPVGSGASYTLVNADNTAVITLAVTGTDGEHSQTVEALPVTVINRPPTIDPIAFTTNEDEQAIFTPSFNDPDGDVVTLTVGTPTHGTGSGLDYMPEANFHGTDSYVFTVTDSHGASSSTVATITVLPVNDPPAALDDTATTLEDSIRAILVLDNDSDIDGDTLSVIATSSPRFDISNFRYTPAPNFHGSELFTYTMTDGTATHQATVLVHVTSQNDPPVVVDETVSILEDGSLTIDLLANDYDVDNDPLTVVGLATADGVFSYTPAANFNGEVSFSYGVSDGTVQRAGVLTLQVVPVNDPPVITPFSLTTDEDTTIDFNAETSDIDGDEVTVTPTSYTPPPNFHGTDSFVLVADDGSTTVTLTVQVTVHSVNDAPVIAPFSLTTDEDTPVDFTAQVSDVDGDTVTVDRNRYEPAPDFHGSDSFVIIASDGVATTSFTVQVTVNPVNDPPVITPFSLTTDEDTPIDFAPTVTDVDGDIVTLNTTRYEPAAHFNGSDSFLLIADDGSVTTTLTVQVTVNPVNDCPELADSAFSTDEESNITGEVVATDVDGEVTLSVATGSARLTLEASGSFSYDPAGSYDHLAVGESALDSYTVIASDGDCSVTATLAFTIHGVNDPPVITPFTLTTDEDVAIDFAPTVADVDGDTVSLNTTRYEPAANFHGSDSFVLIADDGSVTTTFTVQVTVHSVNDCPEIADSAYSTDENSSITGQLVATDLDGTVSLTTSGSRLSLDPGGSFSYDPTASFDHLGAGESALDSYTIVASDGDCTVTATLVFTIHGVNDAPVITPFSLTTDEDTPIGFTPEATDLDGDTVTFNTSSYTPAENFNGSDSFVLIADDGSVTTTFTVQVTVIAVNDPPVVDVPPSYSGTAIVGHTLVADAGQWTDVETATLSFSYQWQLDAADIPDATSSSYTIRPEDVDGQVSVVVSADGLSVASAARRVGWEVVISTISRADSLTFGMSDNPTSLPTDAPPLALIDNAMKYASIHHAFADSASWVLRTSSDTDLVLDWSATALPAGRYLSLYEVTSEVDMTPTGATATRIAEDGMVVIPAGERWFQVRFDDVLSEIFVFRRGWNLFSIPLQPQESIGVGSLWAEIGDELIPADVPEAYRGYWTWQPHHRVYRLEGVPAPATLDIGPGSNTVGVGHAISPAWDLLGPILRYTRLGYRETTVLQPRVGYVIFSEGAQTLNW